MIRIDTKYGLPVFISDEDADLANDKIHFSGFRKQPYACSFVMVGHRFVRTPIHVIVARRMYGEIPEGMVVDHKDSNSLNDTRENLRLATVSQNMANKPVRKDSTSGYKGVYKNGSRWYSTIKHDKNSEYLGAFDTAEEAAIAYNSAALMYFGEFARLNDIGHPAPVTSKRTKMIHATYLLPRYLIEKIKREAVREEVSASSIFRRIMRKHFRDFNDQAE